MHKLLKPIKVQSFFLETNWILDIVLAPMPEERFQPVTVPGPEAASIVGFSGGRE